MAVSRGRWRWILCSILSAENMWMEEVVHGVADLVWLWLKQMAGESWCKSPAHDLYRWKCIIDLSCNSCINTRIHWFSWTKFAGVSYPAALCITSLKPTIVYNPADGITSSCFSFIPLQWWVRLCTFVSFMNTTCLWRSRSSSALQCHICCVTASGSSFHQVFYVNSQGITHLPSNSTLVPWHDTPQDFCDFLWLWRDTCKC